MNTTQEPPGSHGNKYFHPIDYAVFGLMLILSAAIGIFFAIRSRKRRSYLTSDYLMAGRDMSCGPVALSLIASFMSSVTIIGVPAEYYVYGTMFTWFGVMYLFLPLIIIWIFIPVFYDLGIASAYEYLELRFNKVTRLLVTCLYLLLSVLYGGIVTYGPALALSKVTGLNMWGSIMCTGAVCIFYTVLGGLKAVIWTDALQSVIMISGFFVVIIQGSINLGGFSNVWLYAAEGERIDFNHFELDPRIRHTFWSIMIGGTILWTSIFGVNQSQVQRYVSCRTKREAYISMFIAGIGLVLILILAGMTGLTIYATYRDCDPINSGQVEKADQLFPYTIMDIAGHLHGIPGLFVAAVYSSSLSTISSGINAMACVTLEDFIRPTTDWRELTYTRVSRGLVLAYGLSYIAVAYLASEIGGLIRMAYSIHGILGGPITAVFIVGMLSSWVNQWGALSGLIAGIASTFWIFIGKSIYPTPPEYLRAQPMSTEGCSKELSTAVSDTITYYAYSNGTTTVENTIFSNSSTDVTDWSSLPPDTRPPIAEFYAISYLHIATVGFFTTVLIAMVVSVLTGRTKSRPPGNDLLVPCLRSKDANNDDAGKGRYAKAEGVERSISWFQPERLSVHPPQELGEIGPTSAFLKPENVGESLEEKPFSNDKLDNSSKESTF